jgi:hypothetical protein
MRHKANIKARAHIKGTPNIKDTTKGKDRGQRRKRARKAGWLMPLGDFDVGACLMPRR